MSNITSNLKYIWNRTDKKAIVYGAFSNWGLIVLANMVGMLFINTIGIDIVRNFSPLLYLVLGIAFYFTAPKSRDFRIGYLIAFVIGLLFLTLFYYPLFV